MTAGSISRRTFLQTVAALGATSVMPSLAATEPGLKDLARAKGILFGSAIDWPDRHVFGEPEIEAIYARECGIFVMGHQLLWSQNSYSEGSMDYSKADRVVAFAEKHQAKVGGHTLIWHEFQPGWLRGALQDGDAEAVIRRHVTETVTHFKGKIHYWTVVNEGFDYQQRRADGLSPSPIADALGPRYLDIAFEAAAAADPAALLVFNEVGAEHNYPDADRKRSNILRMIEGFKKRGVPIHAIGIESHLRPEFPFSQKKFDRFLGQIGKMGLKVFVTELDVDDRSFAKSLKARDAAVASAAKSYLDVVLAHRHCDTVLTWGLIDKYSWLNLPEQPVPQMDKWDLRNPRKDGTLHRPLPFDDDLVRKPMWHGIAKAIEAAPAR